jgi:hypothetical protein
MRPGPTLAALTAPSSYHTTLKVTRAGSTLATDVPVLAGQLEATATRAVPERLTATVAPEWTPTSENSPFAPCGQVVTPTVHVSGSDVTLGQFIITSWTPSTRDGSVQVTAVGLLQRLAEASWSWPTSPAVGSDLATEVRRIVDGTGLAVSMQTGANMQVPAHIAYGYDRARALTTLMGATGRRAWVDSTGTLKVALESEASGTPTRTYAGTDLGLSLGLSQTRSRPTSITVIGRVGATDTDPGQQVSATASAAGLPSGYGVVSRTVQAGTVSSQAEAQALAARILASESAELLTRPLEIVADPTIELGDTIAATVDGVSTVGVVVACRIPLTHEASMRVDIRALEAEA